MHVLRLFRINCSYKSCFTRWMSTPKNVAIESLPTMQQLKDKLRKSMGMSIGYKTTQEDRAHLSKYLPKAQEDLPSRVMDDSFIAAKIPLASDPVLSEKYMAFDGSVRIGRLLEDMDIFAVMIAHKHLYDPKLPQDVHFPQVLVTVLVDKIEITDYVTNHQHDIKISGHVSWAGKTSLEIVVWLEQENNNKLERITKALFVIAARDPTNTKSTWVNKLLAGNEYEKQILSGGEDRKNKRKLLLDTSVSKMIPTPEEQEIIHDIHKKKLTFVPGSPMKRRDMDKTTWMSDSVISTHIYSFPEDRNLHNTVFGGFLMRHASEITSVLSYKYTGQYPSLRMISDIRFIKPLTIDTLPAIHAFVVYTQENFLHLMVYIQKYTPETKTSDITNRFNFTYTVKSPVSQVIPLTYNEAMMYIDGRRHLLVDISHLKHT
ncbi:acyl-coenzyme A thioesterase 9, mitochondrial-like [Aethina tumida]|uniref:acyl-coenzyme A thioesterase 9, mitochondrial-like n=1 Tax=Aethina tumida TaxID=116153 RepID=UPI002148D85C|nr:acyl-coenzyme A thioesterase 9, mitochondrial-like [Aethina tumida]